MSGKDGMLTEELLVEVRPKKGHQGLLDGRARGLILIELTLLPSRSYLA